jgi:DNA-binding Xre family transcriptional regulator
MKKKDLEAAADIASSTMAKMSKEQPVHLDVLARICKVLEVNIGDILEIIY